MILNPRKPLCWDVSLTTNGLTLNFDTRKEREHVNDTCFKDPVIICLICLVIYCRICQMLVMMCICMCVCVCVRNESGIRLRDRAVFCVLLGCQWKKENSSIWQPFYPDCALLVSAVTLCGPSLPFFLPSCTSIFVFSSLWLL